MSIYVLYQRDDCQLCDEALERLGAAHFPEFISIFIDEDAALEARYGTRIPVLRDDKRNIELSWPFTTEEVHRFINNA